MKKLSACLLALVMMVALCVPAFAGDAVNALTDANAKEVADAVVAYVAANGETVFADEAARTQMVTSVVRGLTIENYSDDRATETSLTTAFTALQADYPETLTADDAAALQAQFAEAIAKAYAARPGVSTFDPSEVGDNIASGFSDSDLSGLFDSLRGAVSSLGDRLQDVLRGDSSGSTTDPGSDGNTDSGDADEEDNIYGGGPPNGDTAVFAVVGVAAVAGAALVLTRKKSK